MNREHTFTEKDRSNRKGKTFGLNARTREEVSRLTRMFSGRSLQEFKEYCVAQGKSFVYVKKYADLLKDVFSTQMTVQQAPVKVVDRNTELLELLLNKVEELTKKVEEQSKRIESLEAALTEDEVVTKREVIQEKLGGKARVAVNDLKSLFESEAWKEAHSEEPLDEPEKEAEKLRKENQNSLLNYKWEF